jgi:hypothetical protein
MSLEQDWLNQNAVTLSKRINERFSKAPHDQLYKLSQTVVGYIENAEAMNAWLRRPILWARALPYLAVLAAFAAMHFVLRQSGLDFVPKTGFEAIQFIESSVNDIIFLGFIVYFLAQVEPKIRRKRAFRAFDELRATIHYIEMSQVDKDPGKVAIPIKSMPNSSKTELNPAEMNRFLSYCSGLITLVGKASLLYAKDIDDPAIVDRSEGIESLAAAVTHKLWAKLTILTIAVGNQDKSSTLPKTAVNQ